MTETKLESRNFYRRNEDMSPDGFLQVFIEDDGDVIVSICNGAKSVDEYSFAQAQFCAYSGGGRSPKVREAVLALAMAIIEENQERPL